jgi:hypothetical protein
MDKVKMEETKAADGKLEAQVKSVDMVGRPASRGPCSRETERRHAGRGNRSRYVTDVWKGWVFR